jgi:hypothetical protein
MNLPQLLEKHKNKEIVDRLIELYPDQKRSATGYRKVLKNLRSMPPVKRDEMKIDVYHVKDDLDPENIYEYESVSGVIEGEDISYAIEYTPWNEWLGFELTENSLKNYSEVDIIAHCLWEMTWSGFEEEQIQEKMSSLMETVKQIQKDHGESESN